MFKNIFLTNRFFYVAGFIIFLFGISFSIPILLVVAKGILLLFVIVCIIENYLLKSRVSQLSATRKVLERLSLGDPQMINYKLENKGQNTLDIQLIDELPYQLQLRDQIIEGSIEAEKRLIKNFSITPLLRGSYDFGDLNIYATNPRPGLIQRRIIIPAARHIEVYPSIIQMKKYELQVFSKTATLSGIRKARKIGESNEFEHIRPYLQGDNIKSINWKATSRKNQLMINEYQNTKSQTIYTIIDKGRAMKMPFLNMTLLDHAINSALVITNIVLKKYDKAGLITFSDKIGSMIKASSKQGQLELISNRLYNQKTDFKEPNFELVYYSIRKQIQRRSIVLFYTNFETIVDLDRNLPFIKSIGKKHLLVVILFINTEIMETTTKLATSKSDIYFKTIAEKALNEKEKIARLLNIHGIQTILTNPEDLSVNVINKYLELKNKRAH